MSTLEGTVVMITGGGTGIGAATARLYASSGARVVVTGRRRDPLEKVAAETGGLAVVSDVSEREQAEAAVATTLAEYGRLDVAVANAGGQGLSSVTDTDDDEWAFALQSNLTTAFVFARAAVPALLESRGQIVIVSSLAGLFAGPNLAGYTVGKHALIGLTRTLARDYGPQGVRANAVCPGWVHTPMADDEMAKLAELGGLTDPGDGYQMATAEVPLRRAAEPEEIATIIRFLGSPDSSYMTGSVLVADGGAHVVDLPTLAFERAANSE
ncbi:SDR family oxidoreductase [Actinobacteria bacterium YIM 96077]|uniref:3-oxoacyl-ACP reductase n=1 Tax=Phytoactinopolyspora halophila TaxID=1981511 RepID=A0A329QK17_9ACTN|nr:SDR family oxidoreductase [Phytoactinopolyspora halophila]AYY12530.1 SDR family oxidoreductase [Actinobacteria bacterium YIM 96077]RAW12566.1 3-oxoacyl-ACP reductase [Phytoactinopolyspora halophila]